MAMPGMGGRVTGTWPAIRLYLDKSCFDWVYDVFIAEMKAHTPLSMVMHAYVAQRTLDAFVGSDQ